MRKQVMTLASAYYKAGAMSKKPKFYNSWLFTNADRKDYCKKQKAFWGRCVARAWYEIKSEIGMSANDLAPAQSPKIALIHLYTFKAVLLAYGFKHFNLPSLNTGGCFTTISTPVDLLIWQKQFLKIFGSNGRLEFNNHSGIIVNNPEFEQWLKSSRHAMQNGINRFYSTGQIVND
jgi:hypothetical protein